MSICSLIPPATAISKTQEPIKHTNEYIQSFFEVKIVHLKIVIFSKKNNYNAFEKVFVLL